MKHLTSHIASPGTHNDRIYVEAHDDVLYAVRAPGFTTEITFQNGTVPTFGYNGLTIEALLAICADRLEQFQEGAFACRENAIAITKIEEALHWLHHRTRQREARGVEGTLTP